MNIPIVLALISYISISSAIAQDATKEAGEDQSKAISIFNGKDLSGWKAPEDNAFGAWWESAGGLEKTALILLGGIIVHIVFRLVILRGLNKIAHATENDLDDRLVHFIRRFYALGLMFALVMMILSANNIEITPLLASAGIVGLAIGLAAKETLADILAGIFLIVDRPMRMGDRIKIERIGDHWGSWGDVVDIGLRRTQIRNTDGVIVNYPNNTLASSVITNFSFEDKPVRVRVRFQVNYDADLDLLTASWNRRRGSLNQCPSHWAAFFISFRRPLAILRCPASLSNVPNPIPARFPGGHLSPGRRPRGQ